MRLLFFVALTFGAAVYPIFNAPSADTSSAGADASPSPRQGAELLKTDIMGVFAHPDDETGIAATLANYSLGKGKIVANVYCTRGEGGGNMVGTQWGASLGILREAELRDCLGRLGVRYCYFLDQEDFFYTESVAATLQKWGKDETLRRLVRLVRALRPEVIVTMNPAPTPGQHGHHQAAAVLATEAFAAAADPARFPELVSKEGLSIWQVRKLYYSGGGHGTVATIAVTDPLPGGKTPAQVAGEGLTNHRSQAFGNYANSPWLRRSQAFTLVKTVVPFAEAETDLLRGLPVAEANAKPLSAPGPRQSDSPVVLEFVPRLAIANYRQWTKAQRIEHVATELPADVPVVAGEANDIKLEVRNRGSEPVAGDIQLNAAEGWQLKEGVMKYRVAPGKMEALHVKLAAPVLTLADAELTATAQIGTASLKAFARAHPVPHAKVPRVKSPPSLDGSDTSWAGIPVNYISPTNLAQGQVKDASDSSARFRLAHDRKVLFIDVEVNDDMIVTNIAPDDIRGHWRSDSVEICIDPVGGAENTMGCFKVGIFPFDTTGVVRAARDADANQGPIEESAPTMRLVSRRTLTGYRIQAAIPFREIGVSFAKTRRLGFNLIVYDGDKADAAVGENINKSRIAWSPRPGVQGRPEDWGRIDLE
ncbi:MAG: PIG-L family deacetylase [Verrucomicrobiota bacterium]